MKKIVYLISLLVMINVSNNVYAASAEAKKTSPPGTGAQFITAIREHNLAEVQNILNQGYIPTDEQFLDAIDLITFKGHENTQTYQPGSREIIQELLKIATAEMAKTMLEQLIEEVLLKSENLLASPELLDIVRDLKKAGASYSAKKTRNKKIWHIVSQLGKMLAQQEVQKAQEMFADRDLKRPLISPLIDNPIAEYLGAKEAKTDVPVTEEDEKEQVATAIQASQKTEPGIKGLDNGE